MCTYDVDARARVSRALVFLLLLTPLVSAAQTGETSDTLTLSPIVVTPSAYRFLDKARSASEVNIGEAANLPLIDSDLLRTVQLFPGVVSTDFSARFQLRGSEKDQVAVRLDGIELYRPFHLPDFGGAISIIDPALVRSARLFMGGFEPAYGDRLGGVFDIQTAEPKRKRRTLVGLDVIKSQFLTEGGIGDATYVLSARRGYIDLILDLIDAIQPLDEKFRPRYADLFGKVRYPIGDRSDLTLTTLYARDTNFIDKQGLLDDLESTYDNFLTWARWRNRFGDGRELSIQPYGGIARQKKREGTRDKDDRDISYGGIRADLLLPVGARHTVRLGGNARASKGVYDYFETTAPFPRLDDSLPPFQVNTTAQGTDLTGYVQDEWQLSSHVAAIFGARGLWQSFRRDVTLSPRVALAVRVTRPLTLRAAWGEFIQPIDPVRLPVEGGIDAPRGPERATHSIVGAEWSPSPKLSVRLEGYRKEFRDLVGRTRDVGRMSQFVHLPDRARAYGAELFIQHRISPHLMWTGGYAYAVANATEEGRTYPRDFDQRHTILLSAAYGLSDATSLNVSWRFHTGTPVTPVTFAYGPDGRATRATLGETNSERVPPFHSLDVRLTRRYEFSRWELTAYFQIINLYARSNIQEYSYDPAENYDRVAENFLPITPTFGLVGRF